MKLIRMKKKTEYIPQTDVKFIQHTYINIECKYNDKILSSYSSNFWSDDSPMNCL